MFLSVRFFFNIISEFFVNISEFLRFDQNVHSVASTVSLSFMEAGTGLTEVRINAAACISLAVYIYMFYRIVYTSTFYNFLATNMINNNVNVRGMRSVYSPLRARSNYGSERQHKHPCPRLVRRWKRYFYVVAKNSSLINIAGDRNGLR